MHDAFTYSSPRRSPARGFTLIEIMVVVTIIVILVAILVPSMYHARISALKAATSSELHSLRTGLQQYYADFNVYPPSTPGYGLAAHRGAAMLAEGLTGYLPFTTDGAGPPNDSVYGFRVSAMKGTGRVYGPYVTPSNDTYHSTSALDQAFIDPWGNEIVYYNSTRSIPGIPLDSATTIFGTTPNTSLFIYTDSSATQPSDPTFLSMISPSGTNAVAGPVLGSTNYLLISEGPPEPKAAAPALFDSNNIIMSNDK